MMLDLDPADEAFLTRLFGPRIPHDETTFRPALELHHHIDIRAEAAAEYDARVMVNTLVSSHIYSLDGDENRDRTILGWDLFEQDGWLVLGTLVMKPKAKELAA